MVSCIFKLKYNWMKLFGVFLICYIIYFFCEFNFGFIFFFCYFFYFVLNLFILYYCIVLGISMFIYKEILLLNELELIVYNYIIKNIDKVMYMIIRELVDVVGVFIIIVLCFCKKMNCDGYFEFCVCFKFYLEYDEKLLVSFGISEIINYFKSINNSEFDEFFDSVVV